MDINYKELGNRVKATREDKNLTQEKLAELTGISNNYISNIERSRSVPSLETVVKLCNALDVTPDSLLCDSISNYCSREYIRDDIARHLVKLNNKNMKLVSKFIELLVNEQEP